MANDQCKQRIRKLDLTEEFPELTLPMAVRLLKSSMIRPTLTEAEAEALRLTEYHLNRNIVAHNSHRKSWLRKHKKVKSKLLLNGMSLHESARFRQIGERLGVGLAGHGCDCVSTHRRVFKSVALTGWGASSGAQTHLFEVNILITDASAQT